MINVDVDDYNHITAYKKVVIPKVDELQFAITGIKLNKKREHKCKFTW